MIAISASHCFDGVRFRRGGATVLVEDGRIVGVEARDVETPSGVTRTSYDGTLLPGLVDAHVHLVGDATPGGLERAGTLDDESLDAVIAASLAQQAAHGVTTVRDLGDRGYRTLAFRDARATGVPRIVAAGPPLTVPGGHCDYLGGAAAGVDALRVAVAEHVERGVDVVKVMATGGMLTPGTDIMAVQLTTEELRAVVEPAHAAGLPVTAHAHGLPGQWLALEAGVDGIEHFSCLTREGPDCPDELLAAVAAAGTVVCPTLGLDAARFPPVELMPPALRDLQERLGLTPQRVSELRGDQLRRAREHGVRIVTGVDSGASPPKWHGMAWMAVLQLAGAGHPLDEALATATSYAAEVLGLGATTGRLAATYDADLLVVDGDLEATPEALADPLAVWVRGDQVVPAAH